MSEGKVLVVEDDRKTVEAVRLYLEHAGFEVVRAYNGRQALEEAERERPDLVVLDLMLPQIDGLEVCRRLRATSTVPIIMLTARVEEDDKLRGLDLGADDYVTKPFSPRELVARVRTVLRRTRSGGATGNEETLLRHGALTLDAARHVASLGERVLPLTPKEFRLLETFLRAPGRAFTRQELLERAFGDAYEGLERTVDAHIANLRRKLEPDPAAPTYIRTVFGVGYRFAERSDAA